MKNLAVVFGVMVFLSASVPTKVWPANYFLCTKANPTHDAFEIEGIPTPGSIQQAEATRNRLQYYLHPFLQCGTYIVKIRAFSAELGLWSPWSEEFRFMKSFSGEIYDITDGVKMPSGISIEVNQ